LNPDLIVWPEASTPYPVNLDRAWVEKLCQETGIPILAGAIIREEELSYNAVVKVEPESGLSKEWYAKQILVPFGEYVPFPFSYIPGLTRLVGPVGTFTAGNEFQSFSVITDRNTSVKILPLVCYEDIFPGLAGEMQYSANSLIFVTTNDAWFAEEGCAEQHAAHSVIRALETGMPILRCGNAGWSGWISPGGVIREVLLNKEGSVYFKGASVLEIEWHKGDITFFTRNGNYFVALCSIFIIFGWYIFELRAKTSILS
jgi:apolipoprotein N-acyltransferase